MATSKRKKRSASSASSRKQAGAARPQVSAPETAGSSTESRAATEDELAAEYSYVRKDLRQLAIISLGLFAVMVVIGFLI